MSDNIPFQEVEEIIAAGVAVGDLIEVKKLLYRHWGIISRERTWNYTTNRWDVYIIHLTFPGDQASVASSGLCTGANWFANGVVREDLLRTVCGQHLSRINNTLDDVYEANSGEETVRRARERIGYHRYHVLFSNCEGFCSYARYGWWVSLQANWALQIRRYIVLAVMIFILLWFLRFLYRL